MGNNDFAFDLDNIFGTPAQEEAKQDAETPQAEEGTSEEPEVTESAQLAEEEEAAPGPDTVDEPADDAGGPDALKEVAGYLKTVGFLGDKEFDNAEDLSTAIEESYLTRVEQGIEEQIEAWKEELDEDGLEFVKYTMAGGDKKKFFETYVKDPLFLFDLKSEGGQEQMLRYYLKKHKSLSEDEIETLVGNAIETDKLESASKKAYEEIERKLQRERKEIADRQVEQERLARQEQLKIKEILKAGFLKTAEVKGFKFSPTERRELFNYVTNPTVKAGNGYVTEFARDLQKIGNQSPEKLALLAKLIKSDFDFTSLEVQAISKNTKQIKTAIERRTDTPVTSKTGGASKLVDILL